jgi:ABC-type transporter Mla subunit MlaD
MANVNPSEAGLSTKIRVGVFTLLGILLLGAVTVFVNDRPFWWRPCNLVHINVEDATGLKMKSPVKSLGLQIGYLKSVELSETRVRLGICVTAPVELLPGTRAYLRADGFLGDKFVELKPVRYLGGEAPSSADDGASAPQQRPASEATQGAGAQKLPDARMPAGETSENSTKDLTEELPFQKNMREGGASLWPSAPLLRSFGVLLTGLSFESWAATEPATLAQTEQSLPPATATSRRNGREIPVGEQSQDVQHLVSQVDSLVGEMTSLTTNLKQTFNPAELRDTILKLNRTLENASKTLSPEGGLNTTAQRTLAKLEDAIEQLRDIMSRVNRGEGSVGMLLNDPVYAQEIRDAIRNINNLLGRAGGFRFNLHLGTQSISAYEGSRGFFQLTLYPEPTRYYLLGVALDPRGSRSVTTTTTEVAGTTTVEKETKIIQGAGGGLQISVMFGKIYMKRIELAAGAWSGDGTATLALRAGLKGEEDRLILRNDLYGSSLSPSGFDWRGTVLLRPLYHSRVFSGLTLQGGLEGTQRVKGELPVFFGASLTFDDDDIKLLFALL